MKHKEHVKRWWRALFGLPQKPCDVLDYRGGGGIKACVACILESPEFARQVKAVRLMKDWVGTGAR